MRETYFEYAPVAESGERWRARPLKRAQEAAERFPAGGAYADGEPWDGITHLERRRVTVERGEWEVVENG